MKNWELHREDLLTPNEFAKLRACLNARAEVAGSRNTFTAIQDRAVCFLAVWTGLRRAEIAALQCGDIHLTNEKPYLCVRHGKGDKFREVVLSPECRAFFKRFLNAKADRGESVEGDAVLFRPQRGARYTADGIYRIWKAACKRAGIPPRSIHKARHFFATALYGATKDLRLVQKQLGHSRITTAEVYTQVDDSDALAGMSALDKRLKAAVPETREYGTDSAQKPSKIAG